MDELRPNSNDQFIYFNLKLSILPGVDKNDNVIRSVNCDYKRQWALLIEQIRIIMTIEIIRKILQFYLFIYNFWFYGFLSLKI